MNAAIIKPDIIIVQETWCHPDICDAFLNIDGYNLAARKDRSDTTQGRGGGILIYAINGLAVTTNDPDPTFIESLAVSIPTTPRNLNLVAIYRPPGCSAANNALLNSLIENAAGPTVFVGDFNMGNIHWDNCTLDQKAGAMERNFLSATQSSFFTQHVDFPTREERTLDLVLSSDPALVHTVESAGHLGTSDHDSVLATLTLKPKLAATDEFVPNYAKADFARLSSIMETANSQPDLLNMTAQEDWNCFVKSLQDGIQECIPTKRRRSPNKPLWMTPSALRIVRKKRRMWREYKTTRDYADFQAYKAVQRKVTKIVRSAKRAFERNLAKHCKVNPRAFFSHINKQTKSRSTVGPLKDDNDNIISSNLGMATLLNSFFVSVFTVENVTSMPVPTRVYSGNSPLSSLHISSEDVHKKLKKLKVNSAPGPDKLPPKILCSLADQIAPRLCIIFNKSLDEGKAPVDWKLANVTPVFKKGSKSSPGNYRPISLTCVICKIMESLLCDAITAHLTTNDLLKPSQHGFRRHRSCLTNLLEFLSSLTKLLDEGHDVDVFYLDFAKAFDKVPTARLLAKVRAHGVEGSIAAWIEDWLTDRMQRVVLNGEASSWKPVSSGVPQGSVLGPLLFLIYINDIDTAVDITTTALLKFADDTKGVRQISSLQDANCLQQDLANLVQWSDDWQMLFNTDKCHILHFGQTNPCHVYSMSGIPLKVVDTEKDLGVLINNSATPSSQVAAAVKKANSALGQLRRGLTYRDKITFKRLYLQFVRPHLEYAVQAWSPWLQRDVDALEDVQKRAINLISGISGSYEEKLAILDIPTLAARRLRGDMIQVFKIVNRIDQVNPNNYFTFPADIHNHATRSAVSIQTGAITRSSNLVPQAARYALRRNFFTNRAVAPWNSLPNWVKLVKKTDTFKANYDKFVKSNSASEQFRI